MSATTDDDITELITTVETLYGSVATNRSDERAAYNAVANLWSGLGHHDLPDDVQRAVIHAIEIGYMTALRDVRNGSFDDELRERLAE